MFQPVNAHNTNEVIEGQPSNKATTGETPIKILKGSEFEYLGSCINGALLSRKVWNSLKLSNVVPV